jgi:hypothetical protein
MTTGIHSQSETKENDIPINAIKNRLLKHGFLWYEYPFCGFFWPQTEEALLSKTCRCYHTATEIRNILLGAALK